MDLTKTSGCSKSPISTLVPRLHTLCNSTQTIKIKCSTENEKTTNLHCSHYQEFALPRVYFNVHQLVLFGGGSCFLDSVFFLVIPPNRLRGLDLTKSESSEAPPGRCMYGILLGSFSFVGSTGNKFFPPDFCQSRKVRLLKVVIPTAPKFLPLFAVCSFALIFCHCSFDNPDAIHRKQKVLALVFRLFYILRYHRTVPNPQQKSCILHANTYKDLRMYSMDKKRPVRWVVTLAPETMEVPENEEVEVELKAH